MALPSIAALVFLFVGPAAAGPCALNSIGLASRSCVERRPTDPIIMAYCGAMIETLWSECQQVHRRAGEPFPPPRSNTGNPARIVFSMREQFTGRRYPEVIAAGNGLEALGQDRPVPDTTSAPRGEIRSYQGDGRLDTAAGETLDILNQTTVDEPLDFSRLEVDAISGGSPIVPDAPQQTTPRTGVASQGAQDVRVDENRLLPESGLANVDLQALLRGTRDRIEQNGGSPQLLLTAAAVSSRAGDTAGAERIATRVLESDPSNISALRVRAGARIRSGDAAGALEDSQRILALDPNDAGARRLVGRAEQLSRGASKIKNFNLNLGTTNEDAARLAGGSGGADERGGAARRVGAAGEADAFGAALAPGAAELAGRSAQVQQLWGSALRRFAVGDWSGALLDGTRLTQLDPTDHRVWLLRSKVSGKLGNWTAAEADARKALELKPGDPVAMLELGYAQLQQGRAAEGLALIDSALALAPRNALGHLYRGEALEALGRKDEAAEAYRLAASLDAALQPLADAALARLNPKPASGRSVPLPPWQKTYRVVAALLASLFLLKGLHFLIEKRRATAFTTRTPMRQEDAVAAPRREPVAGDVLGGNFKIERELARGGMGVVYLATDIVLKRPVAIKRLNREADESEDARRKFLQEAQLAARLKHPNLAQIHSVFGERELYLVFEFVDGEGLDAVLARRGRLGLDETRAVVQQVCRGLEHAHAGRVIHRDLKPANIMLAKDGVCKIMDFGIAHEARTASNPTMTQAWGTPPYMAPEQEDGMVSPASDLFALGVVAYELLSGRRPFDGPSQYGAKRSGTFKTLGGQHGLPAGVDAFFARALNPDAGARFQSAAEFKAAFEALSGTPVRS